MQHIPHCTAVHGHGNFDLLRRLAHRCQELVTWVLLLKKAADVASVIAELASKMPAATFLSSGIVRFIRSSEQRFCSSSKLAACGLGSGDLLLRAHVVY